MKVPVTLRCDRFIITCLLSFLIVFFSQIVSYAQEEEKFAEVSSFYELTASLSQMQSTGGTVVLTQDITVSAEEYYAYNNGRYRKEVIIETNGHTVYVEGYLELWPFLTVRGDGSQKELLRVCRGGELWLVSICLDAGENGVAVVQEEGSFLICESEEDENMGLPPFICTGEIISPQTVTAAPYWRYNCETLPIIRIPYGTDFTADMLPEKAASIVNRDNQEYEEEIPVIWDDTTFPDGHERTLVKGKFADGYTEYGDWVPCCLVVWNSDTNPFFLNVYLESATQWHDMVFMYGESPRSGTVYIQSSEDGETWTDITGTEGYAPVETAENVSFSWILSYDKSESAQQRPVYYRLLQISDDGTELYSDALELNDDLIFTLADIDGGRGGETAPNEGENQISNSVPEADIEPDAPEKAKDESEVTENQNRAEYPQNLSGSDVSSVPASTMLPNEIMPGTQPEEDEEIEQEKESVKANGEQTDSFKTNDKSSNNTKTEKIAGIVIVVCILAGSVAFFSFKQKSNN